MLSCSILALRRFIFACPVIARTRRRNLDFISIVTHVADARTCVLHPASHTHRQLSDEQLREAGIAPDLVRLSVGIENIDDIIADLEQAMAKM